MVRFTSVSAVCGLRHRLFADEPEAPHKDAIRGHGTKGDRDDRNTIRRTVVGLFDMVRSSVAVPAADVLRAQLVEHASRESASLLERVECTHEAFLLT